MQCQSSIHIPADVILSAGTAGARDLKTAGKLGAAAAEAHLSTASGLHAFRTVLHRDFGTMKDDNLF